MTLLTKLKEPFNLFTTILAVFFFTVSIIFSYYLYQLSKQERFPVYAFKNSPIKIYDCQYNKGDFTILSKDSTKIDSNVYVTELVIWNKGNLPINKEDVRENLKISFNPKIKFVAPPKIIQETNPNISKFSINKSGKANEFDIDWEFFDPNFAVKIQFIYSGPIKHGIKVNGYILGNKQIEEYKKSVTKYKVFKWVLYLTGGLNIIVLILFLLFKGMRVEFTQVFSSTGTVNEDESFKAIGYLILSIVATGIYILILNYYSNKGLDLPL